ncbi:MAG TPA: hypothetical protein VKE22_08415 [Haliangiales bacterium]|nr:hypothetical protein [Haliangiales bacterium]
MIITRTSPWQILICAALLTPGIARATPSTTYWAPSTTYVQPFLIPHITYDTYFGKGVFAGQAGSPIYPVTTGIEMGVLPWKELQLELGFDLLLPSEDPFLFNAKLGTPEDIFFPGSPSLSLGIFGVGTKGDATNYDILHAMVQKNLPWGGYVAAGAYYAVGPEVLWTSSEGNVNRAGFMGAISAPDINVNIPGLKKIVPVADIQTGKNAFGAAGFGLYFYFTDTIDLLTGPVFFFDKALQPGSSSFLWTVQLDIDVTLFASEPAPVLTPPAAASNGP